MKKTKILAIDVDKSIIDYLNNDFEVFEGTMGSKIDVSKKSAKREDTKLLLNYKFPENIQEYKVVIQDMDMNNIIPFSIEDNTRSQIVGSKAYYFISSYPETIFDPRPFASYYLSRKLQIKANKPTIKILFQTNIYSIEYRIKNIADYYDNVDERHNNYEHIENICTNNQVCGTEVIICDNRISHILFDSMAEDCYYNQTYNIPLVWKGEERVADDRFIPLLTNNAGQIISYFFISENAVTIMLPQCKNKLHLLEKVFTEILFPHYSEYFPTIDAASWRNHTEYFLPNQQRLIQKKEDLKKQYEKDLIAIECAMKENEKRYSFLHTLLTGSGKPLVDAIIKYLNWLGFTNVIDLDTIKQDGDLLEEDIQIDMGDEGLLIIEVKGINGTSTDSECSQIHKIKFRRCEERGRFDVKALYIVNNERNVEPKKRTIPPFNDTQIKDAINDKRGLAYTWQLFNLFFNIDNHFITKEEARKRLLSYGLIDFSPSNLILIGQPYKYYKNNKIVCLDITNEEIKPGDYFAYIINDRLYKERIISIQKNKLQVDVTVSGKYGFEMQRAVPKGTIYLLKEKNSKEID